MRKRFPIKTLHVIILILFSFIELPAQSQADLYNISQKNNQIQNTILDVVPNVYFSFGQPVRLVRQQDRTPKKVFVLGVYGSAVHAKWYSPDGRVISNALAVASEPEIFWNGKNASEIIASISIPPTIGYLLPADEEYNGPSGRTLDELYLRPLGLSRADAWLCDLVPHSFMNPDQEWIIRTYYSPLCDKYSLPIASVPEKPVELIDAHRRNEIIAELEESLAEIIILLGDDPIKWFLSFVSDCHNTRLVEFGMKTYGLHHPVTINGKMYKVIPLVHVRQAGGLGRHSDSWREIHKNWVKRISRH